jgi:succinyl-CoA synthetase alpha subunit
MRAEKLSQLLKKNDRVAVSNITGREASKVTVASQKYCRNIVGGWALGKGGLQLESSEGTIPVFATFEELIRTLPEEKRPNKIIVYSPPGAVYGEVKEIVQYGKRCVETIFVITEHVSIEVTAKIHQICLDANIDILGCNTLGMINVADGVRVGAVGADDPAETFKPGSVTIISNSGNMVNTIASYLHSAGMGTAYGISTGKDVLILTHLKELLLLAEADTATRIIVLYVEPGGIYEHQAIEQMKERSFSKPVVVYVAGCIAEKCNVSLGHAGAVVEGNRTSATAKMEEFDRYFGSAPFKRTKRYRKTDTALQKCLARGIRVTALHHIPLAVKLITETLHIKRDFSGTRSLRLNPWFVNLGSLGTSLPSDLVLSPGTIPPPYAGQFDELSSNVGVAISRQNMQNASHASSNDGSVPRIFGYSVMDIMKRRSFVSALVLYWTGALPSNECEEKLVEMTLIASMTNGPGTISAQGAKLSASAGNAPNTAMIGTLASIGMVHGGNGSKAISFLLDVFEGVELEDPFDSAFSVKQLAVKEADAFKKVKLAAKEAALEYERIPCLGHPVFRNDPVNYDPRERVVYEWLKSQEKRLVFLDFYHELSHALKDNGSTSRVMAVNVDAVIACVWLSLCWRQIKDKRMTQERVRDIPLIAFALGRVAGGAGEYLDHQDHGTAMDMRVPAKECRSLTKPRALA